MCTFTLCHYACKDCGAAIDSQEIDLRPCNKQRKNWDECRGPKKRGTTYHYLKPSECFYCGDTTFTEEDLMEEAVLNIDLRHQPADKRPSPESYKAKVTVHFTNDPTFDPWHHYATDREIALFKPLLDSDKGQGAGEQDSDSKTNVDCAGESNASAAYDPWGQYAFTVAAVKSKGEN
ncbi:uncharacterized protein PODANS_5_1212 [Podospora anserina S mat+]|uniref:Podospora anserina S mat+ genomic DNA chromosome 5, supercontig 1 n=1 Tax=Podospora anserina (strain S / ATCC MYA-4624 / DSM 980 / FGSC 10383) TaxID=515849 RepID=B2AEX6_PODAN|nr:uncharacterized protein PODANS_5_1212 [Podospora anserina S mat+]CAP61993.1 unnamed protein product [Podospora anserina S mat+]CDP29069.1 Putative protein of unknown function [Podospora anserina S mat+]